jgi:hypothetical protein
LRARQQREAVLRRAAAHIEASMVRRFLDVGHE